MHQRPHRIAICVLIFAALAPRSALADKASCAAAADEGSVLRKDVSKLTKARELLRACNAEECDADIRDDCRRWLDEVEISLPTVVFAAEDADGQPILSVKVLLDGVQILQELDGKPVAVDAGNHTFRFVREGAPPVDVKTLVRAGRKNAEVMARFPRPVPVHAPEASARPLPTPAAPDPTPPKTSVLRPVGIGLAGLGLVGFGLGAAFGIRAMSQQSEANCPDNRCRPEDAPKLEDALSSARISTTFVVAGAALAATGITLYLIAPRASAARRTSVRLVPSFGAGSAGLMVEGVAF